MDNCVISRIYSRIYVNPPVYQCAVRPFNFTDNYIKMLEHNRAMSDCMKAGVKVEDFEKREYRTVTEDWPNRGENKTSRSSVLDGISLGGSRKW